MNPILEYKTIFVVSIYAQKTVKIYIKFGEKFTAFKYGNYANVSNLKDFHSELLWMWIRNILGKQDTDAESSSAWL